MTNWDTIGILATGVVVAACIHERIKVSRSNKTNSDWPDRVAQRWIEGFAAAMPAFLVMWKRAAQPAKLDAEVVKKETWAFLCASLGLLLKTWQVARYDDASVSAFRLAVLRVAGLPATEDSEADEMRLGPAAEDLTARYQPYRDAIVLAQANTMEAILGGQHFDRESYRVTVLSTTFDIYVRTLADKSGVGNDVVDACLHEVADLMVPRIADVLRAVPKAAFCTDESWQILERMNGSTKASPNG